MKKRNRNFVLVVQILTSMLISVQVISGPGKIEIQKLNNALIHDLFINYEITGKNGNLSTIIDYFPSMGAFKYKSIIIQSNAGGENQEGTYTFSESGNLEKIAFQVNNMVYNYEFEYDGSQLSSIKVGGKKKISFGYDKKGRLTTISRDKGGATFEYSFEYVEGEKKANIKLFVVQGEKRRPSSSNYYVTWNDQLKLESFCFDVYCSKNIKYSDKGDLVSYSFSNVNEDNNIATWEYVLTDAKGNWTERKSKDIVFTRTIEYK